MADALYEVVARALRRGYRNGYCQDCGRADPDDEGHSPECEFARAFAALAALARCEAVLFPAAEEEGSRHE